MRHQTHLCLSILTVAAVWLLGGCDAKKQDDSGGDHLPDDKVYELVALPSGADATGLVAHETHSGVLRRFVFTSATYNICLDPAVFDDAALTLLQSTLQFRTGSPVGFGLEGILNFALATVGSFRPGLKPASGRTEIRLVRPAAGGCHLVVTDAPADAFPFGHDDFRGQDRALFYANQLRNPAKASNKVPVAFLARGMTAPAHQVAAQYMIGRFLGLGESKTAASNLRADTTDETPAHGYQIAMPTDKLVGGDDAAIVYGFALVYRDVVSTADVATFQHFGDEVHPHDADQDPDLKIPESIVPLRFVDAFGDLHVDGARMVSPGALAVCVENVSGIAIDAERVSAYFGFATPQSTGSVIAILHDQEAAFAAHAEVVDAGCSLLVSFKNTSQYPFATNKVNGLYAREGSVQDATGARTKLPVIYLNAATLELDPAIQAGSAKAVSLVLQHEFAHFLGFKHAASSQSIMAPAGYNPSWDLVGGDDKIFDAYLQIWRANR